MLFFAYRQIARCLPVFLERHLQKRIKSGKTDPQRVLERKGIAGKERPEGPLLWIHGASVGETQSALSLISLLLEKDPNLFILLTSGTTSSADFLEGKLPERAFHQFVPLDVPHWCDRFLKHWKPSAVLWLESELWPNLVFQTRKQNIPMFLGNARLSDRSFRRWQRFRRSFEKLLHCFEAILPQDEEQKNRFKRLGARSFGPVGNLKFSSAPLEDALDLRENIEKTWLSDRPFWSAASTHPQEEVLLFQVHQRLREHFPTLLFFLAPRHPNRVSEIAEKARHFGLSVAYRSSLDQEQEDLKRPDVLLFDTLGELGVFYRLNSFVVMGGSLDPCLGGHNPIEPAQLSTALIFGPYMSNFQSIVEAFVQKDACFCLSAQEDLSESLTETVLSLLIDKARCEAFQKKAFSVVTRDTVLEDYAVLLLKKCTLREGGF